MARPRALALVLAAACMLGACREAAPPEAEGLGQALLPALASRQQQVEALSLRGPGAKPLVTLVREQGEWRLRERGGWYADSARIAQYLGRLAQVRRVEAKTDLAEKYPRLGVEDIADPDAGGQELEVRGKEVAARVLIGKAHAPSGGRYARLSGNAQSWLVDADIGFDPDPLGWMQRRLLEVPLARVERVRIRPRQGGGFALVNRADRFRPDDAPVAAMRDSHAGDAIAAALDGFEIEDVGADAGATASRELDYELVDGAVLTIAVWRDGARDWARLSASLDEPRAQAWAAQAGRASALGDARRRVADWSRRFAGRRFLLPPVLATTLMLEHDQILAGTDSP